MLKLCVLLAVVTLSDVASAIPVTWEAHGVVREVALGDGAVSTTADALTSLGVQVGATFTVRVSFDSDATLYYASFDPSTGYAVQIPDMRVDFSNWSLDRAIGPISGYGAIVVNQSTDPDGVGNPIRSSLVFAGDFEDRTYSFPEADTPKVTANWGFISDDPYFFSNTHLPVGVPDLAALPPYFFEPTDPTSPSMGPVFYLTDSVLGQYAKIFDVAGEITSVTIVPEPGVGALALVAVAFLLRRSRRAC